MRMGDKKYQSMDELVAHSEEVFVEAHKKITEDGDINREIRLAEYHVGSGGMRFKCSEGVIENSINKAWNIGVIDDGLVSFDEIKKWSGNSLVNGAHPNYKKLMLGVYSCSRETERSWCSRFLGFQDKKSPKGVLGPGIYVASPIINDGKLSYQPIEEFVGDISERYGALIFGTEERFPDTCYASAIQSLGELVGHVENFNKLPKCSERFSAELLKVSGLGTEVGSNKRGGEMWLGR